jgi:Ras-related protein Rab-5C
MKNDFKIVLCGNSNVGKTSLNYRLIKNNFPDYFSSTIGASYISWLFNHNDKLYNFGIWDTAGQERYNSLLPMYFRGAQAILFCCEYNSNFDIDFANSMYDKVMFYSPNTVFYLIFTKVDLIQSDNYFCDIGENWALEKNIQVFYTSSLTGFNVKYLFNTIAIDIISKNKKNKENIINININNNHKLDLLKRFCCF